jgi:hypothetical protein
MDSINSMTTTTTSSIVSVFDGVLDMDRGDHNNTNTNNNKCLNHHNIVDVSPTRWEGMPVVMGDVRRALRTCARVRQEVVVSVPSPGVHNVPQIVEFEREASTCLLIENNER